MTILSHPVAQALLAAHLTLCAAPPPDAPTEHRRRVDQVRKTRGFVALWDFVTREDGIGGTGRFLAHRPTNETHDFRLDARNYVQDYWNQGRPATYADFPLLGRGPFGDAILFRAESDPDFRPLLLVPRDRLHNSRLDVKGRGRSVSMVVWILYERGNHAIAGIWHEGTDLATPASPVQRIERGRRQYALFAGLAANRGAAAVHVSENGASSFGDKYARNLAVTPDRIPAVPLSSSPETLDAAWSVVGFTFDNRRNTVTAYMNGKAADHWIENPERHPFFQWPARAWRQAQPHSLPGLQSYQPPEAKPLSRKLLEKRGPERIELHQYEFTRVRVTYRGRTVIHRELIALRVNPFWFPHDLWSPTRPQEGGPFTIGRVIHTGRSGDGFVGYIGGVAVFDAPLSSTEMQRLATIGRNPAKLLHAEDLTPPTPNPRPPHRH